ncbi:MAG: hypothetical protein HKO62_09195 [Gammaproteobacteria bacterium]|nr:hypothetical protein [Gammaproteobacteria bacterium]
MRRFPALPIISPLGLLAAGLVATVFSAAAPERVAAVELVTTGGSANAEVFHLVSFTDDPDAGIVTRQERQMVIPGGQFSVFAQANGLGGNPFFGDGAAYQDQNGLNAVFVDSGTAFPEASYYNGGAKTHYDVNFAADRFVSPSENRTVPFSFVINGGQLRVDNFSDLLASAAGFQLYGASVSATIRLGTGFPPAEWTFTANLFKNRAGLPELTFDQSAISINRWNLPPNIVGAASRDDFGLGFPALTPVLVNDTVTVDIPRFEGTIPIELLDFDRSSGGVDFEYVMSATTTLRASAPGAINESAAFAAISDPFGLESAPDATLPAVEFFLDGQPLSEIATVPLPAALWYALGGLAILATRHRAAGSRPSRPSAPGAKRLGAAHSAARRSYGAFQVPGKPGR